MTEADLLNTLLTALPNIGVGIIFLYLYLAERKRSAECTKQLIQMQRECMAASNEVKTALDNNTRAIEALTQKVDKPWPIH